MVNEKDHLRLKFVFCDYRPQFYRYHHYVRFLALARKNHFVKLGQYGDNVIEHCELTFSRDCLDGERHQSLLSKKISP